MPNLDPLVRQQSLMFEHSELLREQFTRFGESLQGLYGMIQGMRDEVDDERQQRCQAEEKGASAMASLRAEIDGDRHKEDRVAKPLDDRLLSLREEVLLRARAADAEVQRTSSKLDELVKDTNQQLIVLDDKVRNLADSQHAELVDMVSTERQFHVSALNAIRDEVKALSNALSSEAQQRASEIKSLEARVGDELRRDQESSESSCATLRHDFFEELKRQVDAEVKLRAAELQRVDSQASDHRDHCLSSFSGADERRRSGETALKRHTEEVVASLSAKLCELESAVSAQASRLENDASRALEEWKADSAELSAASQRLGNLLGGQLEKHRVQLQGEREQRGETAAELATEVSQLRKELSDAANASQHSTALAIRSLHRTLEEEQASHSALSEAFASQTSELHENHRSLGSSVAKAMSEHSRIENTADAARLGHEELWHVFNSLQQSSSSASGEMQEELRTLSARAHQLEVDRLGEMSAQLNGFATFSGDISSKVAVMERSSMHDNVAMTQKLDQCTYDLEQTRTLVDRMFDSASKDFIESKDANYRMYVTSYGDVAVFQRSDHGKWGSDFLGVPRWHAGVGEKPVCSVNREMQAHEKDRFLALANRGS